MRIIFDLDGTLCDMRHRLHCIQQEPKDWDSFFKACVKDEPHLEMLNLFNFLSQSNKMEIWAGRRDSVRMETWEWLNKYIPSRTLYKTVIRMRITGNTEPDDALKESWLKEVGAKNIDCVFEDRQRVVDMYRKHGIRCLQVSGGKF